MERLYFEGRSEAEKRQVDELPDAETERPHIFAARRRLCHSVKYGGGRTGRVWRVGRKQSLPESGLVAMGVSCSNSGYVGYPILLQFLGPAAGVGLALTVLIENLLTIPLALAIAQSGEAEHLSWQHTVLQSLKRMAQLPMMQAIVLGFVCSMLGLQLPEVLSKTVSLFAASTAAIALFVIQLYYQLQKQG